MKLLLQAASKCTPQTITYINARTTLIYPYTSLYCNSFFTRRAFDKHFSTISKGVPPPAQFAQQQSQSGLPQHTPYVGNGTIAGETALHPSQSSTQPSATAVPQTPAQQVLMSPADRWGLLGLLAMIKSADIDTNLLSVGTDLGTMGLDMQTPGYVTC